jgi:DNA polymerase-3 subunit epsilon
MELKLKRPICFFDLETTGTDITKDRIVEICVVKVFPDGHNTTSTWLVNPGMHIPEAVSAIHGITDEKVKDAPRFDVVAPQVAELLKGSDIGGFNSNRYDIPLLAEEMLRVGVDFDMSERVSVDVQTIFHKMEQRTLSAAYQFYCDKSLEDAHTAAADTMATYEVLKAQLDRYGEKLENNIEFLSKFSTQNKNVDFAGFIIYDEKGVEVFNFGKNKGIPVEKVLKEQQGYYDWMMKSDFPLYTKKVLTKIKLRGSSLINK